MNIYNNIGISSKKFAALSKPPLSLDSALHLWTYQNAVELGTTTTVSDAGSVGGISFSNPDVASQPTLLEDGIEFDGVSQYLRASVSDFRGGDSTGVLHTYYVNESGTTSSAFSHSDEGSSSNFFNAVTIMSDKPQLVINDSSNNFLRTSSTHDGTHVVSHVQDSVSATIFVDGVKIVSYDLNQTGTKWFNSLSNTDVLVMGAIFINVNIFTQLKWKLTAYTPYVNDDTVTNEANLILNSNL